MAFWKWWTLFVLVCVSAIFMHSAYDIGGQIMEKDPTRISLLIIAILAICTFYIGYLNYRIQFKKDPIIKHSFNPLWFASEAVLGLGMVGTLIGFMMVLSTSFQTVDTASTEEMKHLLGDLSTGIGVALVTTLAGLIGSLYLKLQLVLLELDNKKLVIWRENEQIQH